MIQWDISYTEEVKIALIITNQCAVITLLCFVNVNMPTHLVEAHC